jgi:hypothetical protein
MMGMRNVKLNCSNSSTCCASLISWRVVRTHAHVRLHRPGGGSAGSSREATRWPFPPCGGEISVARTPHRLTVPSRFLARGGGRVTGKLRKDSVQWRIDSPGRRGTLISIVPNTSARCKVSHKYRCGLSTTWFHEARTRHSTPAGRSWANNLNMSASRSPTLTQVVSGQASRTALSASTLSSHLTLSLSSSGRFLCGGAYPTVVTYPIALREQP